MILTGHSRLFFSKRKHHLLIFSKSEKCVVQPNSCCHDLSLVSFPVTFLASMTDHKVSTSVAKRKMHKLVPLALSQQWHDWDASNLCRDNEDVSMCLSRSNSRSPRFSGCSGCGTGRARVWHVKMWYAGFKHIGRERRRDWSLTQSNTPKVSTLAREGDPVHTAERGPCFQQHNILGSAVRTSANGVPFIWAERLSKVLVSSVPNFGDVFLICD